MNVLFLSSQYGIERSGTAYTHRLKMLSYSLESLGIHTGFMSLREQPIGRPILAQPLSVPFIRKKVVEYDFIHAGGDAAYVAAFLKRYTKAQIIYDVHGDSVAEAQVKWQARRGLYAAHMFIQAWIAGAIAFRCADYFLVVSRLMEQWLLRDKYIADHRIGLIRNGVDVELFCSRRHDPGNGFVVCYAGGFDHWQGIENLLNAVDLSPTNHVRFKIIGFTEDQAALKSKIARRFGNRVELVDRVSQGELVSQLANSDVLIIPRFGHRAVQVALPTKFAEYLAVGKPVIVCNVDETADLVRQHQCGLVSEPNVAAVVEAIERVSNLTRDDLERMGKNARCLAEREFSWEHIGRKYAELLTRWRHRDR